MKSGKRLLGMAALTLAVLVATSTHPAAQGFKWWQDDTYKKELGLTSEQTRRLEEIWQKAMPTLKEQKTALDQAEDKFEKLIERADDKEVMEQVNLVEAARADLNKTRTLMLLSMRKVLTRDQWARFTALHQAAQNAPAKKPEPKK